jgi:hypothetical protein
MHSTPLPITVPIRITCARARPPARPLPIRSRRTPMTKIGQSEKIDQIAKNLLQFHSNHPHTQIIAQRDAHNPLT